jgi:rhodanese-related sulfurtransferase
MRILLSTISLFTLLQVNAQQPATVSAEKAMAMAKEGTLIIDVREPAELAQLAYDAPNVVNIPLSTLEKRVGEVPKDKTVVVACRSGNRSAQAIELLKTMGYTNLVNLDGGLYAWQEAKLPVTQGTAKAAGCCAGGTTDTKKCTTEQKASGCCSGGAKTAAPAPAGKTTKRKN